MEYLNEGYIDFLINQKPEEQGYLGINNLYKMSYSSKEHLDNLTNNSVLFFDLETIGFVENTLYAQCNVEDSYPDYKSNNYDNARIVQIGWLFQKKFNYEKLVLRFCDDQSS